MSRGWRRALAGLAVPARWRRVGVTHWLSRMQPAWFGWIVWSAASDRDAAAMGASRTGAARACQLVVLHPTRLSSPTRAGRWRLTSRVRRWAAWWIPGWALRHGWIELAEGTTELVDAVAVPTTILKTAADTALMGSPSSQAWVTSGLHTTLWEALGLADAVSIGDPRSRRRLDGVILELHEAATNLDRVSGMPRGDETPAAPPAGTVSGTTSGPLSGTSPGTPSGSSSGPRYGNPDGDPSASSQFNSEGFSRPAPDSSPQPRFDFPPHNQHNGANDGEPDW